MTFEKRLEQKLSPYRWLLPWLGLGLFAFVLVRTAWLSDDAAITFRSIENLVHGYGPVYNLDERVQTFTHPGWMLLISAVYSLSHRGLGFNFAGQLYWITLTLCGLISLATAALVCFRLARSPQAALVGVLALSLSRAFVDYSTSGLENPLSHLLLLLFLGVYFFALRPGSSRRLFWLCLLAGLAALTRLDLVLLFLPVLGLVAWQEWRGARRSFGTLAFEALLGFLPLALWLAFSLVYYGFPFPNTAYAKLNTGIPSGLLLKQGLLYFLDLSRNDPLTLALLVVGLLVGGDEVLRGLFRWLNGRKRNEKEDQKISSQRREEVEGFLEAAAWPVSLGMALYLLYILRIGGDFMAGRFFTAPMLAGVTLLVRLRLRPAWGWPALAAAVLAVGLMSPYPTLLSGGEYRLAEDPETLIPESGIADERGYYYRDTGLLRVWAGQAAVGSPWEGARWVAGSSPRRVSLDYTAGFPAYAAGPDVHFVDRWALADPLLARLPAADPNNWRIGHFDRRLPPGYIETLESGKIQIEDPGLAVYYQRLSLVIRGDLWSLERWQAIGGLNSGRYGSLLKK